LAPIITTTARTLWVPAYVWRAAACPLRPEESEQKSMPGLNVSPDPVPVVAVRAPEQARLALATPPPM
jgi:hypothetical protein